LTAEDIFGRGAAEKIAFPERLRCFPGTRRITFVEVLNRLPLNGLFRLPMPWPPLWAQRPSFRPIRCLPEIFNITAVLRPCVEGMHGPLTDFCGTVSADLRAGSLVWLRISKGLEGWFLVMSMTDLEIEEAAREAWAVLQAGSAAPPSARRLAAALLALTKGTSAHPHWVTPDDLWRDRLAILGEQGAWLAVWGPRPGEAGCQVPPALLPETQAQRENAYALWHSAGRTGGEVASESKTTRTRASRSRRQDAAEETSPERPKPRRGRSPAREPDDR
jgi:hypothetical protein